MPNPVGRPLKYKTKEALQEVIAEYFNWCDNRIQHIYSPKQERVIEVIDPAPYTMSGLARRLGITRETLSQYKKQDEFSDTIIDAREMVHEDIENRLMEKNANGAKFNLINNFGWKDQSRTEHTGADGGPIETSTLTYMPKQLPDDYFRDKTNDPSQ